MRYYTVCNGIHVIVDVYVHHDGGVGHRLHVLDLVHDTIAIPFLQFHQLERQLPLPIAFVRVTVQRICPHACQEIGQAVAHHRIRYVQYPDIFQRVHAHKRFVCRISVHKGRHYIHVCAENFGRYASFRVLDPYMFLQPIIEPT